MNFVPNKRYFYSVISCFTYFTPHLILFQICRCELFFQIIKYTLSFSIKRFTFTLWHYFTCDKDFKTVFDHFVSFMFESRLSCKPEPLEIKGYFHGSDWNFGFKQGLWLTQRCVTFSCRNQSVHISFTVDDVRWLQSHSVFQHLLHTKNSARKQNATCRSTARPLRASDSLAPRCDEHECCQPEILSFK